jgi:hypothetical protein
MVSQMKLSISTDSVKVYDDVFTYTERQYFYNYIKNSHFFANGKDSNTLEHKGDYNLVSVYSIDDVMKMGFLQSESIKGILDDLKGWNIAQSRVNLSTLNDKNHFHVDCEDPKLECRTLIYYPNMTWDIEWGGYTIITDDSKRNVEHCLFYVPGRIAIIDGTKPHAICAPTNLAPSYRFTFVIQFMREKCGD